MGAGRNDVFSDLLKVTAYSVRGILPIEKGCSHHDADRDFRKLPGESSRTSKRKFRKSWRKIAKSLLKGAEDARGAPNSSGELHAEALESYVVDGLGLGAKIPSRKQRRWRRSAVACSVEEDVRLAKYLLKEKSDSV